MAELCYECKRCNTRMSNKCALKRHYQRKELCNALTESQNFDINELLKEMYPEKAYAENTFDCTFCEKKFNHKSNKYAHEKICNRKNTTNIKFDDYENRIRNLESRLQEVTKQPEGLTTKTNLTLPNATDSTDAVNKKYERYFQTALETLLHGYHRHLDVGITDITTDTFHGEIKNWKDWKEAIGQLMAYNIEDPREKLHMYLFGKCSNRKRAIACQTLVRLNIHPFECIDVEGGIRLIDLVTNTTVLF